MAGIIMPRKKSAFDNFSQYMTAAGAFGGIAQGAMSGGASGAAAGASQSGQGAVSGYQGGKQMEEFGGTVEGLGGGGGQPQAVEVQPMQRRMSQMEQDPTYNIQQARASLSSMPPSYQQQYGPTLDEAYKRAMTQKRQGGGGYYG